MRAYVMTAYGGLQNTSITDMPDCRPGPTDILVRVRAAGLNPLDFKILHGKLRPIRGYRLPVALGNELAGDVVAVGRDVTRFAVGDRIFARVLQDRLGAFAELACVDEQHAARMPASLSYEQAAAVPLAALTALQALRDELRVKPGDKVFISAGAGGVGLYAIQLAKWLGASVATTASPRGEALVRKAGADTVVDYTSQRIDAALSGYDAAFDLIGGETLDQTFRIVKPGGTIVTIADAPEPQTALKDLGGRRGLAVLFWLVSLKRRMQARRAGVRYRFLFMHPSGAELELLASLIDQGRLTVTIDRALPFDEIADALAYLESGRAKGKVVVLFPGAPASSPG